MADLLQDLHAYVNLAVELLDARIDRAATLARAGLDEEGWEAIDETWENRLSAANEGEADGVPPLISAHAEAFTRAQRARVQTVLPFERFVEAARELSRGHDLSTALKRLDLTLDTYLSAQAHWTNRMLEDEALARQFERAVR